MPALSPAEAKPRTKRRVAFFDMVRGFTIISMVAFHATYDAVMLFGFTIPWFEDPVIQDAWRASISWIFLFLAGWMTSFSRNNLRRAAIHGAVALLIWVATSFAKVDTPISFGILFCMAASTLICALLEPISTKLTALSVTISLIVSLALFAVTLPVPRQVYAIEGLAWLGFPNPAFASGDYYPLIPFFFMYLTGCLASRLFALKRKTTGYPLWMYKDALPALSIIGRHSLLIYLIHQPVVLISIEAITVLSGS